MEINGKAVIYSIILLIVLLLLSISLGMINLSSDKQSQSSGEESNENIPEKCQIPPGEDTDSWKEHLGHHAATKECLKYFD